MRPRQHEDDLYPWDWEEQVFDLLDEDLGYDPDLARDLRREREMEEIRGEVKS